MTCKERNDDCAGIEINNIWNSPSGTDLSVKWRPTSAGSSIKGKTSKLFWRRFCASRSWWVHGWGEICSSLEGSSTRDKGNKWLCIQGGDLQNGQFQHIHSARLKFYHDLSLNAEKAVSRVIASKTGMPAQRLMCSVDTKEGMNVEVC